MRKHFIIFSSILFLLLTCFLPAKILAESAEQDQIKILYQQGKSLYRQGKLEEAKEKFEEILLINPRYQPARSKINLILYRQERNLEKDKIITSRERALDVQETWLRPGKEPASVREVIVPARIISPQQKLMEEKVQQVIPEINFTDAHLRDVFQYLSRISGINIILDEAVFKRDNGERIEMPQTVEVNNTGTGSVTGGKSAEAGSEGEEAELYEKVSLPDSGEQLKASDKVTISLKNIPLIEALKYILTAKGLRYRIDEYAILVSTAERLAEVEMETRYYHLTSGIGSFTEYVEAEEGSIEEELVWDEEESESRSRLTVKEVLEESGVPFPPGSKIFLDQRTGTLIVRNTPDNLSVIEDILKILDVTPYQIEIEAKFVQLTDDMAEELGMEWIVNGDLFRFGPRNSMRLDSDTTDPTYGRYPDPLNLTGHDGITKGERFLTNGEHMYGDYWVSRELDYLADTMGYPLGNLLSISGILTRPQFRMILHALNQSGEAHLVSAPKITTLNNQLAQIEMVEEFIYPGEYELTAPTVKGTTTDIYDRDSDGNITTVSQSVSTNIITPGIAVPISFETRDLGIILKVTPSVGADRKTINLTLIPEISEFKDWIDYGIRTGIGWNAIPMRKPIFHTRNVTTSVVIQDGETVVLGGLIKETTARTEDKIPLLGDIPILGVLFRSKTDVSRKTNLVIFVTAKLITPTGELVKETKQYAYK